MQARDLALNALGTLVLGSSALAQLPGYRIVEIPVFASPGNTSAGANATGLNELGHVAGVASTDNDGNHVFLYRDGQLIDLSLQPGSTGGFGKGLNDNDEVVGWWSQPVMGGAGYTSRPFVTSETVPMFDPAVGTGYSGECWGINNSGQLALILGESYCYDPLLWTAAGQTIHMPIRDLSPDLVWGQAEHVNNHGDVVGLDKSMLPIQPVGWISYGVPGAAQVVKHRLRDLLTPADRQAWTRMHPFEINDAGQICGTGVVDGRGRAFLMTPSNPPYVLPRTYCSTAPNSDSYRGAQIFYDGTPSISGPGFDLTVDFAYPQTSGLFFYGSTQAQVPFGDGFRCVGAGSLYRLHPITTGSDGVVRQTLDFTQSPAGSGPGSIQPGATWNFQYWFRDQGAQSGNGFNLSNALQVTFLP